MSKEFAARFPKHSHQFIVSPYTLAAHKLTGWRGADVINHHCRNREKAFTITD
jgi:hypothetical protein